MRVNFPERKSDILFWISIRRSNLYISEQLGCGIYALKQYYKRAGIDYKGNSGNTGWKTAVNKVDAREFLGTGRPITNWFLKYKLLRDKVKEHKCEQCLNTTWNGKKIPLELHRKNGIVTDNNISNLLLLCPNCKKQAMYPK